MSSDAVKGAVSGLTSLLEVLEKLVDNFGLLGTVGLGTLGTGIFKYFTDFKKNFKGIADVADTVADTIETMDNVGDVVENVTGAAADATGAMVNLGGATGKTTGAFKAFMKTPMGVASAIGVAVAAIGLLYNAYKNLKEAEAARRQEAIETADAFLDSADSFEQAYIKYSGRTDLTAEEEAELESAIKGTVDALGNKSSALQNVVNSSNDYIASLEQIALAERKQANAEAINKRNKAELGLKELVKGWTSIDGSEVNIGLPSGETIERSIAASVASDFYKSEIKGGSGKSRPVRTYSLELSADADTDEILAYYYSLVEIQAQLDKVAETQPDILNGETYQRVGAAIDKMSEAIATYESGVYDAAKAQYQLQNGIPKTTEAYLKMRESILNEVGGTLDTRKTIANSLDSEYGQIFDLSAPNAQARKLIGVLDKYGDTEANQMETFLNMRTAVNNNECTVGDYMSQFDDIDKMTKEWNDEEKEELNTSFGLDTDTIKGQYEEMEKYLSRKIKTESAATTGQSLKGKGFVSVVKGQEATDQIRAFLDSLSAHELSAVVNLKSKIDWEGSTPEEILAQIEEEAKLIEAISFSINLELETEKLENLNTAITESISGTGLGTESISLVEDMFGDLDGYDQSKLFERTANGIRLNSDELRKLNNEYKKTNVDGLNDKVDALGERYLQTREELSDLTYGTDEYNDKARELSDIEAQINAAEKLAAQYQGLASAYNEWQRVESAGSQRAMYESMIEGFENVGDEISRGWVDDGTIEFLELIKGERATIIDGNGEAKEINIATASAKELKQVWKDLDKTIEHTSYSVRDFFTVDEDGNSTSQGVYNFLDAIHQLEKTDKFKNIEGIEKLVEKDTKTGNIIGFNFGLVGGDEVIAEALGISEELVQIMKRAADDAGFVVSMDGTYQQLDVLKEKAQEAANKLKDTFKKTKFEFDLSTSNEDSVLKQYQEALKIWEEFKKNKKEDGTVDMSVKGAEEAYTLVSTLQSMVDKLSEPIYMELDTSQVEKDMQTPLSKLQEYETLVQSEHQLQLKGTDTTEIENSKKEILDYFENLKSKQPEIAAKLGIEKLSREEIQQKIEAGKLEIPATIDLQVEMNNTLRDMVNIALYNAGLFGDKNGEGKTELQKRVDISLYADKVDTSDVEEKTDDAVNGKENKPSVVKKDVELITAVAYSDVDEKVDKTIDNANSETSVVKKDVELISEVSNSDIGNKVDEAVEEDTKVKKVKKPVAIDLVTERTDALELDDLIKDYDPIKQKVIVEYFAEHNEVDEYTPEQKEVLVEFIANSENLDSYTPEQKQAIVEYLTDSADPDNWTPEQKEAVAKFIRESGDVDSYTPAQKEAIAKFIRDSVDPDNYQPSDKSAIAKYNKDSTEPDSYVVPSKSGTATYGIDSSKIDEWAPPKKKGIVEYVATGIETGASAGKKVLKKRFGVVNGTANSDGASFANGTTGRAFSRGDWRTKKTETALVGELGREIVVTPNNQWYTVGDNGAEFANIPKNSIVFNSRQTEELLRNGKVTSDGGRARALVNGTAYLGGTAHIGYGEWIEPEVKFFKVGYDYGNKDSDKSQEIFDWIEVAIERIEREIDNLDKKANNIYKTWSERNSELASEIAYVGSEINLQQNAIKGYQQALNEIGLSQEYIDLIKTGAIDIDNIDDEVTADKIKDYQKWYEKILACEDAILDLKETEASLYAQRFEHIQAEYDGILQGYEHTESMLNEYIAQAEAKGHIVSKKYYQSLIANERNNIATLTSEQAALIATRDELVASGKIAKYSEDWYDMCQEIDGVTQAIEEGRTALIEYDNAIRDIDWQVFDLIQERISDVTSEADFLIELMSNKDLFDDKGNFTEQGVATMGLHGQNYNAYMYQADDYGVKVAEIDRKIASGEFDPYDQNVINKRREYIELQRESILAAEDEKNAIKDLVEEGINLELDALQERIDLHNEELDSMKDLYDYQKNVQEQSEEIANLEKQRAAYLNDDSAESQAKLQEIMVSLKEAREDLQETEFDRYISQQEQLLSSLYDEYELTLNTRLDNIDFLMQQVIDGINAAAGVEGTITSALGSEGAIAAALGNNATTIKDTLTSEAGKVGTTLSNEMNEIWSIGDGNAKSVITEYGKGFQSAQTTTNTVLGNIKSDITKMVDDVDKDAQVKVNSNPTKPSSVANPTGGSSSSGSGSGSSGGNKSTSDGKPKIGDKVTFLSGKYYYDSQGVTPAGSKNHGKQVYITNINTRSWATHPYHISTGKKLGVGDLGWLKKEQISDYATGKKNFLDNEIAWTQENGKELIVRPSDGAILTPIAKRDSILNAQASNNIWDMANSPAEFIKDNLNLGTANVPNGSNVNNSYSQHIDNVVFRMDNVKNYEEMLSAMQRDKNFERLVLSMSIDKIAGKSSLAKNKSIR